MKYSAPEIPKGFYTFFLGISIFSLLGSIALAASGNFDKTGVPVVTMFAAMAVYVRSVETLKGSSFTLWIFAFLSGALYFPDIFTYWHGFNTINLAVPLIQIIMFGMGTKLSVGDFVEEFKHPKAIFIGTFLVYSIMPLSGFVIAKAFGFESEIAAGIILIGSCPGGVASNVMTFLADGNIALSVCLTSFATLLSPIVTPLLMKLIAGKLIDIAFGGMMVSILKMIIVPIGAGLIVNKLLKDRKKWINKVLPLISMIAIISIATIVVAHYRDQLLVVGPALIGASIIHNFLGYLLGYWISRLIGLNEKDCRTMSIEVGLKNAGMGMGLGIHVLKSPEATLAPVVFGKWMNISGSMIANYWRHKPVEDEGRDGTE